VKVLLIEDHKDTARFLRTILEKAAFDVTLATDGEQGLELLSAERFDAIVADWMMPKMDGIWFLRTVRQDFRPSPPILMVTALDTEQARERGVEAGADAFLVKPVRAKELVGRVRSCIERHRQSLPSRSEVPPPPVRDARPAHVAVAIAASTGGGPAAVERLFCSAERAALDKAAIVVVLHAQDWIRSALANRLRQTGLDIELVTDHCSAQPGRIFLAHTDQHLIFRPGLLSLRCVDRPPENYVRPSADILFRSLSEAYGPHAAAVVLSGLGRDGALGARAVEQAGGVVLVQDPTHAVALGMPAAVIEVVPKARVSSLEALGPALSRRIHRLADGLTEVRDAQTRSSRRGSMITK